METETMTEPPESHVWSEFRRIARELDDLRKDVKADLQEAKKEIQRKDNDIENLQKRITDLETINKVSTQLGAYGKWAVATLIAMGGVFLTWLQIKKS